MKRSFKASIVLALTLTMGVAGMATPAAASPATGDIGTMAYDWIINRHSGLCLAVAGGSTANNADIVQYWCDSEASRFWQLESLGSGQYRIRNLKSLKCLAIAGGSTATNARAVLFPCDDHISRRWRLTALTAPYVQIVNVNSGKCLTVQSASLDPNVWVIQYPCNTTSPHNETWW